MSDQIGPTGRFPYGKINPDDQGELSIGVAADPKTETVHVRFGTSVDSIAMRPEDAEGLARSLLTQAAKARKKLR